MGAFDLPRGDFELLLRDKTGKKNWESVMFTDYLTKGEIADCVEVWSERYDVLGARYNGREVEIPTFYHWELRYKGEVFGSFATRKEAKAAMDERKAMQRKDKTVRVGLPVYVEG